MRRPFLVTLAAAAVTFAPVPAHAQPTFEGRIAYDISAAGSSMSMEQAVKGPMIRQQLQGPMGAMVNIINTETLDMKMMMPAQKMYMEMNVSQMMQMQGMSMQGEQPDPTDLKATGRTETIAGHPCEHYTFTAEGVEMDMCVAKGLGFVPFASGGAMGAVADPAAWRAHFKDGFLPLSMEMTTQGQRMTMKATKIERTSVPASEFEVPEGYTRMPGMGGG